MRRESCRVELVRMLAEMPFLDCQEMSACLRPVKRLGLRDNIQAGPRRHGLIVASHGSETISSTTRYCLTETLDCTRWRTGGA